MRPFFFFPRCFFSRSSVKNLFQYYFKPLLVYDALQHASSVLCLDSGIELRQSLRSIKAHLRQDGYFLAGQPNTIGKKSMAQSFQQLGVEQSQYNGIQFCAGGMFGFVRSAPAYQQIAEQAAQCAMKPLCYSPPLAGRDNHNFDQSINSILVYKYGGSCSHERKYREMEMARCPIRANRFWPEEDGGVVLCIRRWHKPKPYLLHMRSNPICTSHMCGSGAAGKADESNWMYVVPADNGLIQHTQGSHLSGRSPMAECLLRNSNVRANCTREIEAHQSSIAKNALMQTLYSQIDYARALLVAGLRMPWSYALFGGLAYVISRRMYGASWVQKHRTALVAAWAGYWATIFIVVQLIDAKFD